MLPPPLDLTHLTHLTILYLDGGEETSNLVHHRFFGTLRNATAIKSIQLMYCVLDFLDFPDFIRWFFGEDRRVTKSDGDGLNWDEEKWTIGSTLKVFLFVAEWDEDEIEISRMTLREFEVLEQDAGVWEGTEPPDIIF
ncbi:hypothetical protein BT69DRAFT_1285270 [Atractiella rhizophila]|nr:hypothetical protein BT69DRAFT_1285270 [Atractiella rhizophila]